MRIIIIKTIFFLLIILIGFILDYIYIKKHGITEREIPIFKFKIKLKYGFLLSEIIYISALGNLVIPIFDFLLNYNISIMIVSGIIYIFLGLLIINILRDLAMLLAKKNKKNLPNNK